MSPGPHAAEPDPELDALLDRFLGELAAGQTADLEAIAAQLPRGPRRDRLRREALAFEFVWRQSRGEAVAFEAYAARLPNESDRKGFAEIVRAHRVAERALPPQLAPGALLAGRYRIRSILGRGGMSVVFSAWDGGIEREVAIKVFNAEAHAGSPEEWESIAQSEAAAIARIDHPNVVRVYDLKRDAAQTLLVMDRVAGVDLARALDELRRQEAEDAAPVATRPERLRAIVDGSIDAGSDAAQRNTVERVDASSWIRTVARVLAPVASGIAVAHRLGQVHRDLKPNNVILRRGADPIVLDFGLSSRVRPGGEDSGALRGTPEYFAPEQARDLRTGSDVRTDVYQLGLILFEMLTLERAQNREQTEEMLRFLARVSLGPAERVDALPKSIPRALQAICVRALASNPAERYADAGQMSHDLERFLAGLPNEHARTGAAHEAWQRATWLARKPAFAALVLGGLALGAGAWMRAEAAGREDAEFFSLFHFTPRGESITVLPEEQVELRIGAASREELLGVEVKSNAPRWVYTLGVTGDAQGARGVYPRKPTPFRAQARGTDWALRVPGGQPSLIEVYLFDGNDPEEGVLAIARDERSAAIEGWLAELDAEVRATRKPVPYDDAMARFERVANTRVRGAADLSAGEADRDIFRNLKFERAASQGESPDGRIKWFQQVLKVARSEE